MRFGGDCPLRVGVEGVDLDDDDDDDDDNGKLATVVPLSTNKSRMRSFSCKTPKSGFLCLLGL